MAGSRHPGIFLAPASVAIILVALAVLRGAGVDAPWVQGGLFVIGLATLAFTFLDMLVRDIRQTHLHPIGLRAGVIGVLILETLGLFSLTYLSIAEHPGQIAGMSTPLDSVYFTMTTLMTIGFGDIAAQGQLARGTVLVQMFFSVVVLSASVRLLSSLTRSIARTAGHHDESQGH